LAKRRSQEAISFDGFARKQGKAAQR